MIIRKKIFLLDDDELILTLLSRVLEKEGYEVRQETEPHDVLNKIRKWSPDVVMLDIKLPGKSGIDILKEIKESGIDTLVVMLTSDDTAATAVKAMKLGAVDYLTKPFNSDEVRIVIKNILDKDALQKEVVYLRKAYSNFFMRDLIGESDSIKELKALMEKIAGSHVSTILITGESGVGKEVVAKNIHYMMYGDSTSGPHAPFVSINCAAMPETLLESELFGHMKGSFTDAKTDKKGLFEEAAGGTVLLDEVGDMQKNLQSKLLRVLEERTIRRVGGKEEIPISATIIATTNRKLQEAVKNGDFRQDLFFRLSAFYMHVLPLRKRQKDIPVLARYFLSIFARKYNKKKILDLSPEAEKLLISYDWPGNVRELKNLMERFVVLENIDVILPKHLPNWLTAPDETTIDQHTGERFILPDSGISIDDLEKDLIIQALEKTKHNQKLAAKLLTMTYDVFRYQMKKYGIQ